MRFCYFFLAALLLGTEARGARPLDQNDYRAAERCAQIVKAVKLTPAIKLNKDEPALSECSKARSRDVCQEAKRTLDGSPQNRGKMQACLGTQVADAHVIRINIINPTTGERTHYNSVGASLGAARENADQNFNYLRAMGWKPQFFTGN